MPEIIPAILSKNYDDLKNKISLVRGIVPIVQIDICDGIFVNNKTWPFSEDSHLHEILSEQEGMPFWEDINFELDLMVTDAVENFNTYLKLGPKRMIFHIEAQENLEEFRLFLEGVDMYIRDSVNIGIAISPTTPIKNIFSLVSHVDFVQCMGIEKIGFQGQEFYEGVLEHIKTLKEKFPGIIISVDGGVSFGTAKELADAGADRLIVGSVIFKSQDIRETISELENL